MAYRKRLTPTDRCSPVCGKWGRAIVQAMRPVVATAAVQPSRRDEGSKAAVNLKRRNGKSSRTTMRTRCAASSNVELAVCGRSCPARATAPSDPKHSAAQRPGLSRRRSQYQSETTPSSPKAVALT